MMPREPAERMSAPGGWTFSFDVTARLHIAHCTLLILNRFNAQ